MSTADKDDPLDDPPLNLDEDNLEAFFPDEDEAGFSAIENLNGVMKRVSKKAALMIEGITACQTRMDHNFNLIKQYLREGKKPGADFQRQVMPLSEEFIKISNLKFTRENAEEVYIQAKEEWNRQLQQIAEKESIVLNQRTKKQEEMADAKLGLVKEDNSQSKGKKGSAKGDRSIPKKIAPAPKFLGKN